MDPVVLCEERERRLEQIQTLSLFFQVLQAKFEQPESVALCESSPRWSPAHGNYITYTVCSIFLFFPLEQQVNLFALSYNFLKIGASKFSESKIVKLELYLSHEFELYNKYFLTVQFFVFKTVIRAVMQGGIDNKAPFI